MEVAMGGVAGTSGALLLLVYALQEWPTATAVPRRARSAVWAIRVGMRPLMGWRRAATVRRAVGGGGAPRRGVVPRSGARGLPQSRCYTRRPMPRTVHATVTATGDSAALEDYRSRLNALLGEEFDGTFKELHTPGRLEYRLSARAGLPFPALVAASAAVPDLAIEIEWEDASSGMRQSATVEGGALKRQRSTAAPAQDDAAGVDVRADADGTLVLAVACRRQGEDWIGYALTAGEHAFFRVRPGPMLEATDGVELEWAERWRIGTGGAIYAELDPREPVEPRLATTLARLADEFAEEWVWFAADDPVETAIERSRYADYGYRINDANLRSAKLRGVMHRDGEGHAHATLGTEGAAIAALVGRHWLQTARQ